MHCKSYLAFEFKIIQSDIFLPRLNRFYSLACPFLSSFCVVPALLNLIKKQELFVHPSDTQTYTVLHLSIEIDIEIYTFPHCIANEKKFDFHDKIRLKRLYM